MEKPTPTAPPSPAAATLGYRGPGGGRVPAGRLVGTVLLGLFWLAAGAVVAVLWLGITLAAWRDGRPPTVKFEAVALWWVATIVLVPGAVVAFALAAWHMVVLPIRMSRSARVG